MNTEDAIIQEAKAVVYDETGSEDPRLVMVVLARLFICAQACAGAGFGRINVIQPPAPRVPAKEPHVAIDEVRKP
jgi:hypothetical protein